MNLNLKHPLHGPQYQSLILSLENRLAALKRERDQWPTRSRQYHDLVMRRAGVAEALERVRQTLCK